jgi:hypothetical protein
MKTSSKKQMCDHMAISFINIARMLLVSMTACPILRLLYQQKVARMYDVFWPLELSSKCYLAAFIAILAFLMWPNIILEFNRYILWNITDIRAVFSEEFRIITETGLH